MHSKHTNLIAPSIQIIETKQPAILSRESYELVMLINTRKRDIVHKIRNLRERNYLGDSKVRKHRLTISDSKRGRKATIRIFNLKKSGVLTQ